MSAEQNKQIVQRLFNAFNEHQFENLEGIVLSPALIYTNNGKQSGLRQWLQDEQDCVISFPDIKAAVENLLAKGDQVVAQFRLQGTHLGPLGRVRPTRQKFDVKGTATFRIQDNLIVEEIEQLDEKDLLKQLGLG
jgi:predicted ester cyclase